MPDKYYLVEVPGQEGVARYSEEEWDGVKDKLYTKFPEAKAYQMGGYDPEDEQEDDHYIVNVPEQEGTAQWNNEEFAKVKDKLTTKYPDAQVTRLRPVNYWKDKAQEQETAIKEQRATMNAIPQNAADLAGNTDFLAQQNELEKMESEYKSNPYVVAESERQKSTLDKAKMQIEKGYADLQREYEDYKGVPLMSQMGSEENMAAQFGRSVGNIARGNDLGKQEEYNTSKVLYDAALRNISKAEDILDKPNQTAEEFKTDFVNLLKGFGERAISGEFISRGMQDMYDLNQGGNLAIEKINTKLKSLGENATEEDIYDVLSPAERAYVSSLIEVTAASAARAPMENVLDDVNAEREVSKAYQTGAGIADLVGFVAEFLMTGGITSGATSAATKGIEKFLTKAVTNRLKAGLAQKVGGAIVSMATKTANAAMKAPVRTALMGATGMLGGNVAKERTTIQEDGTFKGVGQSTLGGTYETLVENFTEEMGPVISDALGVPFKAGKHFLKEPITKALSKVDFEKLGRAAAIAKNVYGKTSPWTKIMAEAGFHGPIEEWGEELLGSAIRNFTSQPGALKDFFNVDQQLILAGTFAPMTLFGLGGSTAQFIQSKKQLSSAAEDLRMALLKDGMSEEQARYLTDYARTLSAEELAKEFTPIINQMASQSGLGAEFASSELFDKVARYVHAVSQYQTFDAMYQEQEGQQRQDKLTELEEKYGKFYNETDNTVNVVSLNNGKTVFQTSEFGENGEASAIDAETGKPVYFKAEDRATSTNDKGEERVRESGKMSLDSFVSAEIMRAKEDAQTRRMRAERQQQIGALAQSLPKTFNLGTEGDRIDAAVKGANANGVAVVDQEGNETTLDWDKVGRLMNKPIRVLTDNEVAEAEAAQIALARENARAKYARNESQNDEVSREVESTKEDVEDLQQLPEDQYRDKQTGQVDEVSFWENNPEGYCEWNDRENQDGGKDSLEQINFAKAKLEGQLKASTAAAKTDNSIARKAANAESARIQERIDRLTAIEQKYANTTESQEQRRADEVINMRERVNYWREKLNLGDRVVVYESLDEVENPLAKKYIQLGKTEGWYDPKTNKVYLYMPHITSTRELDSKIMHEVVTHYGLANLLGEEQYNALMDKVWNMMSDTAKRNYYNYANVSDIEDLDKRRRTAAEEFLAKVAEDISMEQQTPEQKSLWQRIVDFFNSIFKNDGVEFGPKEVAYIIRRNFNSLVLGEELTPRQEEEGAVFKPSTEADVAENALSAEQSSEEEVVENILKPTDSNGVTAEQNTEINRSVGGEMEAGDSATPLRFSSTAMAEGAGVQLIKDDGNGNVAIILPNGKIHNAQNLLKPEDISSLPNTVLGYMMRDAMSLGVVDKGKEWMLWNKYTIMLNAILTKGSAENGGFEHLESQWQWVADSIYKTVAINSDSQYSFSLDITRVCKKNEAVINAIAEMQRRLGYGITPGQIMDIYLTTIDEGYQVPCPVCYVFSRYIRNGKYATIMINGQRKYGDQLVDPRTLTEEQKKERIEYWLNELKRIKDENKANSKQIAKANSDITTLLDEIDAISKELTDPANNLSDEQREEKRRKIYELDARYKAALNVVSQASLDSWITQFAIQQVKIGGKQQWVLFEDSYMGFPEEMALDIRQTATVMRKYPAIQRFRNSRGAAAGKEITFVSNNDIGDVPLALGSAGATKDLAKPREMSDEEWDAIKDQEYAELKLGVKNLYRQAVEETDPKKKKKLLEAAKRRFTAASIYAKQQSLRGGQRMWSWSDNIERLAPDVFVNLLQLEMLGGALQSYSKQLEGIKLVASMNGYVNGSLMGKGNGYREVTAEETEEIDGQLYLKDGDFIVAEQGKKPFVMKTPVYQHTDGKFYVLEFDDVVGVDPFGKDVDGKHMKGLFELNAEYDRAGNIIVGMNDLHIRMCMADDRIFFIIPWHSSGANSHILAQMYDYLGVTYDVKESQDYTDVQSEKRYKGPNESAEEDEAETTEEIEGEEEKKEKESNKITQFLVDFWNDHYENAREYAGYGAVAGKDFACGIEGGVESSDGNGNLSESQMHYRELRDAIFVGVKVETGALDKNGKPKTKTLNVEDYSAEWFNEIMNDEFLSQVYRKVRATMGDKGMTSKDSKAIYPYEYWDENSSYGTADINGARYLEYCRRLGYKPKFCGKLDGKPESDHGNFTDDRGYWKVLIDRRMYGLSGQFQDLTPVTAENFTPDLVDPEKTKEEFVVTRVADEKGTQTIVDGAIAREEGRVGGLAKVNYDMTLGDALNEYSEVEKGIKDGTLRFSTRSAEQREKLFDAAKAEFGVTNNFNVAGYMLPDGSLLDLSEENNGGPANKRTRDHREIGSIIEDRDYDTRTEYITDFLNEGAIRILPESNGVNLSVAPSAEQREKLLDYFYKKNGYIILEIDKQNGRSAAYIEYDKGTSPYRIIRDIDGYFNEGIVPQQSNLMFSTSNGNQAIFVSNAAKAVEGIKMEKATPEQWLKMIEKNGGLKAGEDKWMGLSDWLKASDKKTLTKQEVLDFVNEHMIQIEEQHYGNREKAFDDKYPNWRKAFSIQRSSEGIFTTVWNIPTAVSLYNQYHKETINIDEYGGITREEYDKIKQFADEIAIEYFGTDEVRQIHNTRLTYTTDGLENKHEIVLTVPNIESWKKSDDIHFGDAGDGRAVAWIRFGDTKKLLGTTEVEGKKKFNWAKVLVIDEIQSKRHQEGREKGYRSKDYWKRRTDYLAARTMHDGLYDEMKAKYGDDWINADTEGDVKRLVTEEEFARLVKANEEFDAAADAYKGMVNAIPDAPFDKNWHELAMKRMLRYAAENGYDVVAWTKGEQQAERYNIGDVVASVDYRLNDDGTYHVDTIGRNGYQMDEIPTTFNSETELAEIFGKDIARKIAGNLENDKQAIAEADKEINELREWFSKNTKTDDADLDSIFEAAINNPEQSERWNKLEVKKEEARRGHSLSETDFRIGGEGMKGFYDKILPAFMNKYGKKWGVKVEDIHLNLEGGLDMHSVPVTDEMKESVMEGQLMFSTKSATFESTITPEVRAEMDVISAQAFVNGNYLLAPNGQPTKLTPDQWALVRTKNFINWFGDWENDPENASKVVDPETGEPMVVHHGTISSRFSTFDDSIRKNSKAPKGTYWFAEDEDNAMTYAGSEDGMYATFVNLRKPAIVDVEGGAWYEVPTDFEVYDGEEIDEVFETYDEAVVFAEDNGISVDEIKAIGVTDTNAFVERAKKSGKYDGVIIKNVIDAGDQDVEYEVRPTNEYVVFSPNQIKSATENNGEFSESEDIRFSTKQPHESAKTFMQNEVDKFYETYGSAAPAKVVYANSRKMVADALGLTVEEMPEEIYQIVREEAKKDDAFMVTIQKGEGEEAITYDRILIFAKEHVNTTAKVARIIYHENVHAMISDKPELLDLGQWLLDNPVGLANQVAEDVKKGYSEDKWSEEMICDYVGAMLSLGRGQEALDSVSEEYKPLLNYVYERFKYNPEIEDPRRRSERLADARDLQMRNTGDERTEFNTVREDSSRGEGESTERLLGLTDVTSNGESATENAEENEGGAENEILFSTSGTEKTIDEIVAEGRMTVASENKEAADNLAGRIRAINGSLTQLRQIAAAQREYDKATVKAITDLAKDLVSNGKLGNGTRGEIKRLLSIITDATGKKDLSVSVDRLMDLMIANQLRYGEDLISQYLKIRGKKVDQRGVEVQGRLDLEGQQIMAAFRDAINLSPDALADRIAIAEDNLSSESETIRRNAENELVGLELAKQYQEEIANSKEEESNIRQEIKTAEEERKAGLRDSKSTKEFIKTAYDAIRENRMQRVNAYQKLAEDIANMIVKSVKAAGQLRDAEKARIEKIHHFANSDMQGMASDEHGVKESRFWNSPLVRFFLKPLATFDQMLRSFAPKSSSGEGYLWNHFMGGWLKATEKEYKGVQAAHERLDEMARIMFGALGVEKWSDIFAIDRKMPKVTVSFWDGGEMKDHEVTQGNLLYIYMVNKMIDGKMKLRKMGITEDDVDAIVAQMDPRFIQLADWMQEQFLPSLRDKYNAVHEKLFGAPMAAIDSYFPIKVLANARVREVDLGVDESNSKPSTITGSIIKRTKNSLALDVMGANAFDVILEHIQQMEHWAAFAEFNRDLNTLLSYRKFRNRVQNMSGIYGTGPVVWNNFRAVAEIAAGVYKPASKSDSIDKTAINIAKGVTGAKISFRVYTAMKQLLSMPAFVSDANITILAKNIASPWNAWKWAMEELPMFEKRWKSRQAGDSRLMQTDSDWKIWKTKVVELAGRYGMTPNAFIDALTVSIGARSIYETKLKQYLDYGYNQEQAEEKAKRDATVLFNESQQSNESAFLSAIQVDRTTASVAFTVFRNSAMGYQRMAVDAWRNMAKLTKKEFKRESIEYMKKQMVRDGLTEAQAERAAQRIYSLAFTKNAARIATFQFLVQFAWNLGAVLPYLLVGSDDDEKQKMVKDAAIRGLVGGPIEGLTGGSIASSFLGNAVQGESIANVSTNLLPVVSDIEKTQKMLEYDKVAAINELFNIAIQSGVGVNPQTFTDIIVAVVDACNGDLETSKEALLCIMRILQVPQSQIEKVYMDEIDFPVDKGLDLRIEEFAKRYADYKVSRGAPLSGWLYSDEEEKAREDKYIKKFIKTAEELKRTKGSAEAQKYYEFLDGSYKEINETISELKRNTKAAALKGEDLKAQEYAQMLSNFLDSDLFKQNAGFLGMTKAIERLSDKMKRLDSLSRSEIEDAMLELRKELVDEMRASEASGE